jgi:hypothetical protein
MDDATADGAGDSSGPPTTTGMDCEPDTGVDPTFDQCEGLLWAVNEDKQILLIDLVEGSAELSATMDHSSWAAATRGDGNLLIVPRGNNGALVIVDPRTGDPLEAMTVPLGNDDISRATFRSDSSLWLANYTPGELHRVDLEIPAVQHLQVPPRPSLPVGGDHVFADDTTLLVLGSDNDMVTLDMSCGTVEVVSVEPVEPASIDNLAVSFTGIAATNGSLWGATYAGVVYELVRAGDAWVSQSSLVTGFEIGDLTPVYEIDGACPP